VRSAFKRTAVDGGNGFKIALKNALSLRSGREMDPHGTDLKTFS
jgi:hypothetical protein